MSEVESKEQFIQLREMEARFRGVKTCNEKWSFYYDETGNCRKFRLTDDGSFNNTNALSHYFILGGLFFDTKEDAEKYLEETLIPEDQANLESCYGIDEDEELAENYEFSVENGSYDRKQLIVYDTYSGNELNTTIYEVVEVNF